MRKFVAVGSAAVALLLASTAYAGAAPAPPPGPVCQDEDGCIVTSDPGGGSTTPTGGGGTTTTGTGTSNFSSAFTTYSSRAAFTAAFPNGISDNFEGVADRNSGGIGAYAFQSGTYTDPNGVTFSAPTNGSVVNLNILDSTYLNGSGQVGAKFGSDVLTSNTEALTINFAPTTAFGIDFGAQARGFTDTTDTFTFTVAGQTQSVAYNGSGLNFFGFSSATPFTSVTINATAANSKYYDNATIAAAAVSAAPEPGAWAFLLTGVGAMGLVLRRRRTSGASAAA